MILFQFLNNDVTSALIPVLSIKPDKAVFFYDEDETGEKRVKNIEKTVKKNVPGIKIVSVEADRLDFADIAEKLITYVAAENEMVFYSISGGSEIECSCGMLFCYKTSGVPVYVNYEEKQIKNVITGDKICDIAKVSLEDYIEALGAKKEKGIRDMPDEKDFDRVLRTAEYVFDHEDEWKSLCTCVQHGNNKKSGDILRFTIPEKSVRKTADIISFMIDKKFVHRVHGEKNVYEAENGNVLKWLKTFGYWLEMYVFINGLSFFDQTDISVKIDWDGSDSYLTENEIDVVGIKDSVPWFISCKMCEIEPYAMHEVSNLANHFGGESVKRFVATTRNKVSANRRLYMQKMNVGLIEVTKMKNKTAEEVFLDALRIAEIE